MQEYFVVYVTCKSKEEAHKIAQTVLENHLVACVNIVPLVESVFWWEGKLQIEEEVLLIMKTKEAAFEGLKEEIKRVHSYTVPEIIGLPIKKGNLEYLKWIEAEVTAP